MGWLYFWNCFPVAVPEKIIGLTLILDFFDRCHSLASLFPPPAAVGSLLRFSLASPVQTCRNKIKTPKPKCFGVFMELLARFELATSSLPRMRSTG